MMIKYKHLTLKRKIIVNVEIIRCLLLLGMIVTGAIGWSFHGLNRPIEIDIIFICLTATWILLGLLAYLLSKQWTEN